MAPLPVRLGVVDDHPPILHGVLAGLSDALPRPVQPTLAPSVDGLLGSAQALDLVLLDLQLGDQSRPADNVARLVERGWPVLLYTQETNRAVVAPCFRAGAVGIVGKHEDFTVLAKAVEVVLGGDPYLSGEWAAAIEDEPGWTAPHLAPREAEALRLYAMGLPLKSVARRMGLSPETVKEYLLRTRRKYSEAGRPAATKTELYIRAVEDGILPRPGGASPP